MTARLSYLTLGNAMSCELDDKIRELKKKLVYHQFWGSSEFGTFLIP
jgi:hypothetical protein